MLDILPLCGSEAVQNQDQFYELNTGTSIPQIQPLNELHPRTGMVKVHTEVRKSRIYDT